MPEREPGATPVVFVLTGATDHRPVYLTGNFNDWQPNQPEFEMKQTGKDRFEFTFPDWRALPHPVEYKYTRGGWDQDERDQGGYPTQNRVITTFHHRVTDHVARWASPDQHHTAPLFEEFDPAFRMKPLRKKRRISVLLPHDYYENTDSQYPVLYMLDAQNLAGAGSQYGNWQIDKQLEKLAKKGNAGVIVVMIDHGEAARLREFSPYTHRKVRNPQAAGFLEFVCSQLKPAIDTRYRTRSEREYTGIGGSSMGGLFSAYAGLMRPDVFSKLMIFSPSLWIAGELFGDVSEHLQPMPARLYLYAGGHEGARTVSDLQHLNHLIEAKDDRKQIEIRFSFNPKGRHQEARWGEEFGKALPWLYFN